MTVVFLEGLIITVLVLSRFREAVMDAVPMALKRAIGVGISWPGTLLIGILGTAVVAIALNGLVAGWQTLPTPGAARLPQAIVQTGASA